MHIIIRYSKAFFSKRHFLPKYGLKFQLWTGGVLFKKKITKLENKMVIEEKQSKFMDTLNLFGLYNYYVRNKFGGEVTTVTR